MKPKVGKPFWLVRVVFGSSHNCSSRVSLGVFDVSAVLIALVPTISGSELNAKVIPERGPVRIVPWCGVDYSSGNRNGVKRSCADWVRVYLSRRRLRPERGSDTPNQLTDKLHFVLQSRTHYSL